MAVSENEYNYRFKLTDYTRFDRNRPRKVAVYGRVSTEHEAQLSALENQLQWYEDQFQYHSNWTEYQRYIDEGITGTQAKKRPAFLRMLDDARKGKFDLIVTREVCRFARNVVDTLVVTRELKGIGVEVYFIEDNIWTMDGDGELRLSLMATLAQEESRKTSERVKAGQKISRDNHVLYGSGNILGYDRVGDTYVINEEQAETVKMIFDLYLQGNGSMKIKNILSERHRKNASGEVRWHVSYIIRVIKNATYTGRVVYNKSRSNNFLEQKRIYNLDMSTFEYAEGNFPAIISWETWKRAQEIREGRTKPTLVSKEGWRFSHRDSADVWVNILRCNCGSSFRKNRWHVKKNGQWSYGYQCYNQLTNGKKATRVAMGLDGTGFCDIKMIAGWKLDFMAKELFSRIWLDRKEAIESAIDLIERYYKEEDGRSKESISFIRRRIETVRKRIEGLIAMRADGELSKEEYTFARNELDKEIAKLTKEEAESLEGSRFIQKLDIKNIRTTLQELTDNEQSGISQDLIKRFVFRVTPTSDTSFDWFVKIGGAKNIKSSYNVEGRQKNRKISLEGIEEIPHTYNSLRKVVDFSKKVDIPRRLPSLKSNLTETE